MTLPELIAALEKAEGPSRELDKSILESNYPGCEWRVYQPSARKKWLYAKDGRTIVTDEKYIRGYTSSIDAALTLLPAGALWFMSKMEHGPYVKILAPNKRGDYIGQQECSAEGATPAIALCIAALKVREALKEFTP